MINALFEMFYFPAIHKFMKMNILAQDVKFEVIKLKNGLVVGQ